MLRPAARAALTLLVCLGPLSMRAAGPFREVAVLPEEDLRHAALSLPEADRHDPERLVAAALALTVGPFGAHRLYLGTDVKVPLIYGLTFGGFGVLVVLDLVHILCTKDLDAYRTNGHVFMWNRGGRGATPP